MRTFHLTESQLEELSGMGAAGTAVAKGLRLWRKVTPGPWGCGDGFHSPFGFHAEDGRQIGDMYSDDPWQPPHGPIPEHYENGEAIVHARNSAELVAAAVFWEITGWDTNDMSIKEQAVEMHDAIGKALEELA